MTGNQLRVYQREYKREQRLVWAELGVCVCGCRKAQSGFTKCSRCRKHYIQWYAKRAQGAAA